MARPSGFADIPSVLAATKGVLIAGGRSSRMGVDKASLRYEGQTLLELTRKRIAEALQQEPEEVWISGRAGGIPDLRPGLGPVGGLASVCEALRAEKAGGRVQYLLVVPVDMPRLNAMTLRSLALAAVGREGAVFKDFELPVALAIGARLRSVLAQVIEEADASGSAGSRSVRRILSSLDLATLDPREAAPKALLNVNTPEDWQRCLA